MNKPTSVKVDDKIYNINTDFRVAIECNEIANSDVGDYERALAIIYKLFGEKGLDCENKNKLLELAMKYLTLGNEQKDVTARSREKYELDYSKCEGLIRSSFKFDYKYDPYELEYLHYYDYVNDLQNLSTSEFGNCCILNRIASIINTDETKIKDNKERTKLIEAKKELVERYCIKQEKVMTEKQRNSAKEFFKALGQKGE